MDALASLNTALAGRYEIEREIGAGGMATVYLARDARHHRSVALKVLRPDLGAMLGVERFLSEIRVTANLQHPNLLPLFDSGEAAGQLFYVMPFVEGESLRARLERDKQLPVDDAIHIATAIASALDYAHRHNVIHRDLKPENILLHDGQPLVADFGIALAVSNAGGARITQTGLSLGTPQYMSPEQATGDRVINARTDIYSLGAVTYEMLVGDPPHTASTSQAVIAKVLTERPSAIRTSRPNVAEHVEAAVQRALEKLPADRFASAHEFADALSGKVPVSATLHSGVRPTPRATPTLSRRALHVAPWMVATVAVGFATWDRFVSGVDDATTPPVTRTTIPFEGVLRGDRQVAVSPDGRTIAYVTERIYVRHSHDLEPRALDGTSGARGDPTFSPDGQQIAFVRRGSVFTMPLSGRPTAVTSDSVGPIQLHWGTDGHILMASAGGGGCYRVPAAGGASERLFTLGPAEHCRWPELLPDSSGILYTLFRGVSPEIRLFDFRTRQHHRLVSPGRRAHFVAPGYLVYQPDYATVLAIPVVLANKRVTGTPVPLLQNADEFEVSLNGTAIYRAAAPIVSRLFMIDPRAAPQPLSMLPGSAFRSVQFSPDGRRVVYGSGIAQTIAGAGEVFVTDLAVGNNTRILPEGWIGWDPFWALDGQSITFTSTNAGTFGWDGFIVSADGRGPPRQLFKDSSIAVPQAWLPDGRLLVRSDRSRPGARGYDLFTLTFVRDSVAVAPYLAADWDERNAQASPDGRHVAFMSDETGRQEVYVRPFPDPSGGKWQISENGGRDPVWSRDGNTLHYWEARQLRAVRVRTRPTFAIQSRETVLTDSLYSPSCCFANYDVHPDGKRFIMARREPALVTREFIIVTNWFEELKARMTKRTQ